MKHWTKVALLAFCAGLPLLMAPTGGGIPSKYKGFSLVASGTFTMTQTGCAGGASTPTVRFVQTLRMVSLELPTVACTSTSTSWTWSGIPAALRPPNGWTGVALACIIDNGAQTCGNGSVSVDGTGVITFLRNGSTSGWTASGAKNLGGFSSFTYGIS